MKGNLSSSTATYRNKRSWSRVLFGNSAFTTIRTTSSTYVDVLLCLYVKAIKIFVNDSVKVISLRGEQIPFSSLFFVECLLNK